MSDRNTVTVRIYGQEYSISGELPRDYILTLADYVDGKMHDIAGEGTMPVSGVAVLTAVNMADEYFNLKKEAGDSKRYAAMWEDVKRSFVQCKDELDAASERIKELEAALGEKAAAEASLSEESKKLQGHNEVLRTRIEELTEKLECAESAPCEAQKKLKDVESRCRDIESSYFDIQMENLSLKNELDGLKKQLAGFDRR